MAASFGRTFAKKPILAWAIDDWETFYEAMNAKNAVSLNFVQYLENFKKVVYNQDILPLYTQAPLALNLGGDTEKTKIKPTDKSTGVFDFSLASIGMYKVPEYYSSELAKEQPNKFVEFELPSGVIPPDLVQETSVSGQPSYFYKDLDKNKNYVCEIRQKGQTAIDQGVVGAQLKFATKNKKVYLTYKRNRGRVKYVEIYSLFYYTDLSGPTQYAVRHIPAMMVADYLESRGVKTRFYMTRFVQLFRKTYSLRDYSKQGVKLPMYDLAPVKQTNENLFVQPIIVKDYGEDFDKALAFLVSTDAYSDVYDKAATYAIENEVNEDVTNPSSELYGQPRWSQSDYYEGFDRYRNKYKMYTEQGVLKAKEVLGEALLFFHDIVIRDNFAYFMEKVEAYFPNNNREDIKILSSLDINPFFLWWMRLSANTLRDKIDIINSLEMKKDLIEINKRLESVLLDFESIVAEAPTRLQTNSKSSRPEPMNNFLKRYGDIVLKKYKIIDDYGKLTFVDYVTQITNEITTYAEGPIFESTKETQEVRNNILKDDILVSVLTELQNF
jgi:hypothetical protein